MAGKPSIKSKIAAQRGDVAQEQQNLPREEWCFNEVSPEEQRACLFYEYSRESSAVIQDRSIWRTHFAADKPWPTFTEFAALVDQRPAHSIALHRFYNSPVRIVAPCDKFPNLPWSLIPAANRKVAMELVRWSEIEEDLALAKKHKTSPLLAKFTTASFPVSTWAWTDEELIERFSVWLRENRDESPEVKPRGRKGSPTDLLDHLRIMRLARHAKRVRGSVRKITELEMDERNIARALRKAEAFLSSIYT